MAVLVYVWSPVTYHITGVRHIYLGPGSTYCGHHTLGLFCMRCTDRAPQSEPCTPDPSAAQPGNIKQDNYRKQGNSLLFITCSKAQGIDSREVPIIVFQMANLFLKVRSVNIFESFEIYFQFYLVLHCHQGALLARPWRHS